jgi:hypothetical protein
MNRKEQAIGLPRHFLNNKNIKYGAPINATIIPAGMPSGSTKLRPMVSASNNNNPPIKMEIGRNN